MSVESVAAASMAGGSQLEPRPPTLRRTGVPMREDEIIHQCNVHVRTHTHTDTHTHTHTYQTANADPRRKGIIEDCTGG